MASKGLRVDVYYSPKRLLLTGQAFWGFMSKENGLRHDHLYINMTGLYIYKYINISGQ